MMRTNFPLQLKWPAIVLFASMGVGLLAARQQQPPAPAPAGQQPTEVSTTITGDQPGSAPRLAVPDFIALSNDKDTVDAAKLMGQVLWDDLNYEREFTLIARDAAASVPAATSLTTVPFARWRELLADGVVVGTVQKTASGLHVEVRLFNVKTNQSIHGVSYDGGATNKRLYAHRAADDLHKSQRGLQGVAQTKITFNSDRANLRLSGTTESRSIKEIMYMDYDGENVQPVTANRGLAISPVWSPDGRSIAYTRYPTNAQANIWVANIFEAKGSFITDMKSQNMLPAWSPDGTQIAFTSWRTGNAEIWVSNRDGSNARNLTNSSRSDDITPTWSPSGRQIAFTSDRTGSEQIWLMEADGLGQQQLTHETKADRATWSLAPLNQIAYSANTGPGYDIKIIDMATKAVKQLTFGEGSNESPAFAPNGRHLLFTSTRAGKEQVFSIDSDGKNVRQLTSGSNNKMGNWSQAPKN